MTNPACVPQSTTTSVCRVGYALVPLTIVLFAQAGLLHLMGQPAISASGTIRLWTGDVLGPDNSQQLTDWYTPSHVIHGILFYAIYLGIGRRLFPRMSWPIAFVLALASEFAWEINENSPWVIDRYRQQALAQGYSGDSIVNSCSDTLAMSAGFLLAHLLPTRLTVAIALAAEICTAVMIRDNLTLNIVQLLAPNAEISAWQSEGGLVEHR